MTALMDKPKLERPVLVLNKCWAPIRTIPVRDAIHAITNVDDHGHPKARVIDPETFSPMNWADWTSVSINSTDETIKTATMELKIPEIIVLSHYDKQGSGHGMNFSRRNLFRRDKYTCQYCGCHPKNEDLTIDHVVPRAQGGVTSWENCVLSCFKCNAKKANRTPKQARMKLLCVPKKPNGKYAKCDLSYRVKSWEQLLGAAYWNLTLDNDM